MSAQILEQENVRLLGVMSAALKALDDGRYGDLRRILKTGNPNPPPLVPTTNVVTFRSGQ